jgi:hypothetical protein
VENDEIWGILMRADLRVGIEGMPGLSKDDLATIQGVVDKAIRGRGPASVSRRGGEFVERERAETGPRPRNREALAWVAAKR